MKEKINEKIRFIGLTKSRLRDFNIEEARGWTIDRLRQIEYRIDTIIIDYFRPANKNTFDKIVLNSSILDIGKKLKILRNIGTVEKNTIEKIRKLAAIRNGFAHAPIIDNFHITIYPKKDKSKGSTPTVVESMIYVMNSQGEIIIKSAFDYLVEFWSLNKEIRKEI